MSWKFAIIGVIVIGLVAAFFAWQVMAYKTPEPKYAVITAEGPIEIRAYPDLLVAEVKVKGERYAAINDGFRVLADYIFGNNRQSEQIAMTAPVIQQGSTIQMTAPVIQQQTSDGWVVRFVMPDTYTEKTLPTPNNRDITIITMPTMKYAVVRFSGRNSDSNMEAHLQILLDYVNKHHLKVTGSPIMAFYNPPWILPFLRRNEIFLEIKN